MAKKQTRFSLAKDLSFTANGLNYRYGSVHIAGIAYNNDATNYDVETVLYQPDEAGAKPMNVTGLFHWLLARHDETMLDKIIGDQLERLLASDEGDTYDEQAKERLRQISSIVNRYSSAA
jgi:hypothetical protein